MRVYHIKDAPRSAVYVGRSKKGEQSNPWGNPFKIGKDGDRDQVIKLFEDWLLKKPRLLRQLFQLRGKSLSCWCCDDPNGWKHSTPYPWKCHAQVLMLYSAATCPNCGKLPDAWGLNRHYCKPCGNWYLEARDLTND